MLVHDNVEDLEVFEDANDAWELVELQTVVVENTVELSINSVVRLFNPGTMKVRGEILNQKVVVLIDCERHTILLLNV